MALGNFSLDLSKFVEKAGMKPEKVRKKVSFDIHSRIKARTPVDTGRAKAGWMLQIGGSEDLIFNNVEYINMLEYGHSQQAPAGMVRVTIAEFQAFVAAAVASLG